MEYMPAFTLHRPETVEDAVNLRNADKRARYLAGGTDMVVNVRRGIEQPTALIDLGAVEGMTGIAEHAGGWRVGASVTLQTLGKHAEIARAYPAVSQAARAVAGPTHRGYGTVGSRSSDLSEPPDTEPYVRWCGRTAGVTPPPTRCPWNSEVLSPVVPYCPWLSSFYPTIEG